MKRILNYIGGEFKEPHSGQYLDDVEPATGLIYAQIPDSDQQDIEDAVKTAQSVQPNWARISVEERSAMLMKIADLIDRDLEILAKAESTDNG